MPRYIDADALIRKIQEEHKFGSLTITELISECPTADVVEVVRGEWKLNNLNGFKIYDCSNCGVHMEAKFNYCPFCGADMRGGRNEQIY